MRQGAERTGIYIPDEESVGSPPPQHLPGSLLLGRVVFGKNLYRGGVSMMQSIAIMLLSLAVVFLSWPF
jgi:hypothetical protein